MKRCLGLFLVLTGCAPEAKVAWTFDRDHETLTRAPPLDRSTADADAVVTIEPRHTDDVVEGAAGGPLPDDDETVLDENEATLWLELPTTPSVLMLQWPLPATGVTSAFGERSDPIDGNTRFHYGIDLEADYGQVVKAAAAGRVARAGFNNGHGRQVVVSHAGGFQTGYSHLSQTIVYEGQLVEAGEALGLVGTSGRTTGPHLHFEVMRYGTHVDPASVLGVALKLR